MLVVFFLFGLSFELGLVTLKHKTMIAVRKNNNVNSTTPFNSIFEPLFGFDDFGVRNTTRNAYKVNESEKGLEILFSLPGFDKKEVEISLESGQLKVEAKKEEGTELHFGNSTQKFVFTIDQNKFDFDTADANLNNGILTVSIPTQKAFSNKRVIDLK